MEVFYERLNELFEQKQITKYKFAQDLGVNKQTVSFWLSGTNEPKISCLKDIAVYFGVSTDYLLGLEDDFGVHYQCENIGLNLTKNEKILVKKVRELEPQSKEMVYRMLDIKS